MPPAVLRCGLPRHLSPINMFTSTLDDREVQLLIVALRYWRTHRIGGVTRRTDPQMPPDIVDILLAKLEASTTDAADARPSRAFDAADAEL